MHYSYAPVDHGRARPQFKLKAPDSSNESGMVGWKEGAGGGQACATNKGKQSYYKLEMAG